MAVLFGPGGESLDDRVEARNVAPAGKYPYTHRPSIDQSNPRPRVGALPLSERYPM